MTLVYILNLAPNSQHNCLVLTIRRHLWFYGHHLVRFCGILKFMIKTHINRNYSTFNYSLLRQINDVQNIYCDYGILKKVVPLLARTNQEISMEVLCLIDVLLFNANKTVQVCLKIIPFFTISTQSNEKQWYLYSLDKAISTKCLYFQLSLLKYFQGTCEEMFFQCVRYKLQTAMHAIKERYDRYQRRFTHFSEFQKCSLLEQWDCSVVLEPSPIACKGHPISWFSNVFKWPKIIFETN